MPRDKKLSHQRVLPQKIPINMSKIQTIALESMAVLTAERDVILHYQRASQQCGALFCVIGNSSGFSYYTKKLREDRTAADRKMSINRPAAGGESRKRDSFLCLKMAKI